MLIWQEIFLKPISNRLTNVCLNMIETERHNHIIMDTHLIEGVINSYSKSKYYQLISNYFFSSDLQF